MTLIKPKYPNIHVPLAGEDGNAFAILGRVMKELRRNNVPEDKIEEFHSEATSGDYNHLLCICMSWVDTFGNQDLEDNEETYDPEDYDEEEDEYDPDDYLYNEATDDYYDGDDAA